MEEEQYSFDLNLDFLESSTTIPKNATIIAEYPEHQIQSPFDIESLATRIASVNEMAIQLKVMKNENSKLHKQMFELKESAMSIQNMYKKEKAEKEELAKLSKELKENYDIAESQLTNKTLHFEQIQSKLEEETADKKPITYNELALKYQRLAVQMEEEKQLHSKEKVTLHLIKEYLASKNLSPLPMLKKKLKKNRELPMQSPSKPQTKDQHTQCSNADGLAVDCVQEPKDTCTQGTQYTWYTTTRGTNTPALNIPKIELKTQGTQYISSMTTRGTNTSSFIKTQSIDTNFPEPLSVSVEDIFREMIWDVAPLSPMIESPPEMKEEKVEIKSIGTNTCLRNVRKPIDYVMENIKRSDSRPPSRNMFDRVKNEAPSMGIPGMNPFVGLGMSAPPLQNTMADLWNMLGHTIFAVMQTGQTQLNPMQTNVASDRTRNLRRNEQTRSSESQSASDYFEQDYPRDYPTSTRNTGTSPIPPPELVSGQNMPNSQFASHHTSNRPVEIQKIVLNKSDPDCVPSHRKPSQVDDILELFPEYSDSLSKRRAIKRLLKAPYKTKKPKKKEGTKCSVSTPVTTHPELNEMNSKYNWKTEMHTNEYPLSDSSLDNTIMEYTPPNEEIESKWPPPNTGLEPKPQALSTIYENFEYPEPSAKEEQFHGFGEIIDEPPSDEVFCKPLKPPKRQDQEDVSSSTFLSPNDLYMQPQEQKPNFCFPPRAGVGEAVNNCGESNPYPPLPKQSNSKRKRKDKKLECKQSNKMFKVEENRVFPESVSLLESAHKPKRSLSLNRLTTAGNSVNNVLPKVQTITNPKKEHEPIKEPTPTFARPQWMNRRAAPVAEDLSIQVLNQGKSSHGLVMSVERPPDSMFQDIKTCIDKQKNVSSTIKDKKEFRSSKFIGPLLVNQSQAQSQNETKESTVAKEVRTMSQERLTSSETQNITKQEPQCSYTLPPRKQSITILNEQWISNSHDLRVTKQENTPDLVVMNDVEQSLKQENIPIYFLSDPLPSDVKIFTSQNSEETSNEVNNQETDERFLKSSILSPSGQNMEQENNKLDVVLEDSVLFHEALVSNSESDYKNVGNNSVLVLPHQNMSTSSSGETSPINEPDNYQSKLSFEEIDFKLSQSGFDNLQNIYPPKTMLSTEKNVDDVGSNNERLVSRVPRPSTPNLGYTFPVEPPLSRESNKQIITNQMSCKEEDSDVTNGTFHCNGKPDCEDVDSKNFVRILQIESNFETKPEPLKIVVEHKDDTYAQLNGTSLCDDARHLMPSQSRKKKESSSLSNSSDSEGELQIDCPMSPKPDESSFLDLSSVLKTPEGGRRSPEFKTPENLKNTSVINQNLTNSTEKLVEDYLLNESPGAEGPKFQTFLDRILGEVAPPLSPISVIASEKLMYSETESSNDEIAPTKTSRASRKCKRKSAPTAAIAIKRSARLKAKTNEVLSVISQSFQLGKYTKGLPNSNNGFDRLACMNDSNMEEDGPEIQPIRRQPIVVHETTEEMFDNFLKQKMKLSELSEKDSTTNCVPEGDKNKELDYAPMSRSTMKTEFDSYSPGSWQSRNGNSFGSETEIDSVPNSCEKIEKLSSIYEESPASPINQDEIHSEGNTCSYGIEASFDESPSSPPAIDKKPTKGHIVRKLMDKSDKLNTTTCNSMLSHLINNYDVQHHQMVTNVDPSSNKIVTQLQSAINEFLAGLCLMMDSVRLVDTILSLTSNEKLVAKALVEIVKTAPRPETEVSGQVPELYLGKTHTKILACLEPLYQRLPGLQLSIQSTIEQSLFTFSNEIKPICLLMNLTQLYLAIIANPLEDTNPARLFICKCLYFYNQKSVPMIYETLCVYPSVLPKRDDPQYDRSDILISTIQSILMSTYYDPDKCDFLTRQTLAKLRMFYNYESFKPPRDEVIKNMIAKIRAGRFKNVSYAFALICKRMEQPQTEKFILTELLLPLANEYYHTISQNNENDENIACVIECISFVIKPFNMSTDISPYVNLFLRFMNATNRKVIQEAALAAILRTVRFGYVQCFNAIYNFKPTYELSDTTMAMLRSFVYKKGLKFLKQLDRQAKVLVDN